MIQGGMFSEFQAESRSYGPKVGVTAETPRSPGPNNLSKQKEVSNGPQKVTNPIFVNPPPEGLLNNAATHRL